MKSLVHDILLREFRKMDASTISAFKKELEKREQDLITKQVLLRLIPQDDAVIQNILLNQLVGFNYTCGDSEEVEGYKTIYSTSIVFDGCGDVTVDFNLLQEGDVFHDVPDVNHFCQWLLLTRLPIREGFWKFCYVDSTGTHVTPMHEIFNALLLETSCVDFGKLKV